MKITVELPEPEFGIGQRVRVIWGGWGHGTEGEITSISVNFAVNNPHLKPPEVMSCGYRFHLGYNGYPADALELCEGK
jgi:hypothetical protein